MDLLLRLRTLLDRLLGSLWLLPSIAVAGAAVLGTWLVGLELPQGSFLQGWLFNGTAGGARALLTTIAGSMITVTGVVFSLTVVTLQLASSQYSPRLLRNFLHDPANQIVLSGFLATFAYCVAVLRLIRAEHDQQDALVPELAVFGGVLLALVSLGLLVFFVHHLTQSIRVEEVMRGAQRATLKAIDHVHPHPAGRTGEPPPPPEQPAAAVPVPAQRSGHVQTIHHRRLTRLAREHGLVLRLWVSAGDQVLEGTAIAWAWPLADGCSVPPDLAEQMDGAVRIGFERTLHQDVRFGLRQLVDIAVKALSPGVNDPATAVDAVGALAVPLSRLALRQVEDLQARDDDGVVRLIVPLPAFDSYLSLCCDEIRRYGASEPAVTSALLWLLGEIASLTDAGPVQQALTRQADLVLADAERETAQEADLVALRAASARGAPRSLAWIPRS